MRGSGGDINVIIVKFAFLCNCVALKDDSLLFL